MKRFFFLLTILAPLTLCAESVKVTTIDGKSISGYLVDGTDSTYTIRHQVTIGGHYEYDTITFRMRDIYVVNMYGHTYVPVDGKLVSLKSAKPSKIEAQPTTNSTYVARASNPNLVIGNALKSTGGVAIGVGVPCVAVGAVLWAIGSNQSYGGSLSDFDEVLSYSQSHSRMVSAGMCLTSIGGALTIVGIPLYVHGKKIMTMNLNYTGNGAGVSVQF